MNEYSFILIGVKWKQPKNMYWRTKKTNRGESSCPKIILTIHLDK